MLLQLKPLFMGQKESLPLHCELDLSELVIGGSHPFPHPVVVEGKYGYPPTSSACGPRRAICLKERATAACGTSAANGLCRSSIFW